MAVPRKRKDDRIYMLGEISGKLPPQAVETEQVVLGAILGFEGEALFIAKQYLEPDSFYDPKHKVIYEAILELNRRKEGIDITTVFQELKKQGTIDLAGGGFYVTSLTNRVSSTKNTEYHVRIIQEQFLKRQLITQCQVFSIKGYEETNDIFELIEEAKKFFNQSASITIQSSSSITKFTDQVKNDIINNVKPTVGYESGLTLLDYRIGGFQPSDLIIIAGRPGQGKTVLMTNAINRAYEQKIKSVVYSYEMTGKQLVHRLASQKLSINHNAIRSNIISQEEKDMIALFCEDLYSGILINDENPDLYALLTIMEKDVVENGVEQIWIDYLQLIPAPKELLTKSRNDYIGIVSFALKTFAKKFNVPVAALAQLSRESEKRIKPGSFTNYYLSDLRESGSLEQAADLIMFIDRMDENARIQIAKFRHGQVGNISVTFEGNYVRFKNNLNDPSTKKALAHYELTGEINVNFEHELETRKEEFNKMQDAKVPIHYRDPTESNKSEENEPIIPDKPPF